MFKKIVLLGLAVSALLFADNLFGLKAESQYIQPGQIRIGQSVNKQAERYADFAELWLIITPFTQARESALDRSDFLLGKIKELEKFVKRKPNSFLADDAKIAMAELYHALARGDQGENKPEPNAELRKSFSDRANEWLFNVVRNHRDDLAFDIEKGVESKEPTTALALYYLGIWNNAAYFLERLIVEYPDSKISRALKSAKKSTDK